MKKLNHIERPNVDEYTHPVTVWSEGGKSADVYTLPTHHTRHIELHSAMGELIWDYLRNKKGSKMTDTILELSNWSAKQVDGKPDHPESTVKIRRRE
jgi:hypothetical protein